MVQIEYPLMLACPNQLVYIDRVGFLMIVIFECFFIKNQVKKNLEL